jgi:imidazolonepropionase-like amidohydrolase
MQLLLVNARLLEPATGTVTEGHLLLAEGHIIAGPAQPKPSTEDCQVIDLRGRTLMPGLIDCHVHVGASMMNLAANAALPDALAILRALPILRGMLDRGFTTVRDVGGAPYALAVAQHQRLCVGPRLVVCGKALGKTGGHTEFRGRYDYADPERLRRSFGALGRIVDGVDALRKACREELREGAQFIKIMGNGGIASPTDPIHWHGFSVAETTAAVEEARDAGTYVASHLYTDAAIARAVSCGVHSLEHCNLIEAATARAAADAGCVAVPTLVTYEALAQDGPRFGFPPDSIAKIQTIRSAGLRSLETMRDAGLPMAYGTDLLGETHVRQNEEFRIRAQVLPAMEILRSATSLAARLCGMAGVIGTLQVGGRADLIAVDGNPDEDAALLADASRIALVVQDGRIHRSTLD